MTNFNNITGFEIGTKLYQFVPKNRGFNIFSSRETVKCSGLLISHPLTWMHKFKSCTLRIRSFSNEKTSRHRTKTQVEIFYLGFFVLVGSTLPIFPRLSQIWDKMGQILGICGRTYPVVFNQKQTRKGHTNAI